MSRSSFHSMSLWCIAYDISIIHDWTIFHLCIFHWTEIPKESTSNRLNLSYSISIYCYFINVIVTLVVIFIHSLQHVSKPFLMSPSKIIQTSTKWRCAQHVLTRFSYALITFHFWKSCTNIVTLYNFWFLSFITHP